MGSMTPDERRLHRNAQARARRKANPEKARKVMREFSREYRAKHPEKIKEYQRRYRDSDKGRRAKKADAVRRLYGLALWEYDALLTAPCGLCGKTSFVIDHCHETGIIRGALCQGCNVGLGLFGDDAGRLRAAASYIDRNHDALAELRAAAGQLSIEELSA